MLQSGACVCVFVHAVGLFWHLLLLEKGETTHWVLLARALPRRSHAQREGEPQGLLNALVLLPECCRRQSAQANREKKVAIEPT